jgi:hypothetical protein
MRILLLLFVSIQFTFSQSDPLFKIISCSEGALLDGVQVKPGQLVYPVSLKLQIPKKGYVGLITKDGYAHRFEKSLNINVVNNRVNYLYEERKPNLGLYSVVDPLDFQGSPLNQYSRIFGDSILLAIIDNDNVGLPYLVKFLNMFDKVIYQDSIRQNWNLYNVRDFLKEEKALLIQIQNTKHQSLNSLISLVGDDKLRTDLNNDLSRIPVHDIASIVALFEIHNFYYDQLFYLYKAEIVKNLELDPISKVYLSRLREKYQFNLYSLSSKK